MEVDRFSSTLIDEMQAFASKIKQAYDDSTKELNAKIKELEDQIADLNDKFLDAKQEISELKNDLDSRIQRSCPKGFEEHFNVAIIDVTKSDKFTEYNADLEESQKFDKAIEIVRRDDRSYKLYIKNTIEPNKYPILYFKSKLPVTETTFHYIVNELDKKYKNQFKCHYNRIFLKNKIYEKAVEYIKSLIENFKEEN